MAKFIYGSYRTFNDAEVAVEDLIRRGVDASDITIAKNNAYTTESTSATGVEVISTEAIEDNDSWWDDFLELFRAPEDKVKNHYNEYRDLVAEGDVLVLVEESYLAQEGEAGYHGAGYVENYDHEAHVNDGLDENHTIKLHEEQLKVRKERESLGQVEISKHTIHDTKTVEVPVQREEVHITRTNTQGGFADDDAFQDETIVVPLSEETVHVDKETVVSGEVNVDKSVETHREQVSEDLRREIVDVEDQDHLANDAHGVRNHDSEVHHTGGGVEDRRLHENDGKLYNYEEDSDEKLKDLEEDPTFYQQHSFDGSDQMPTPKFGADTDGDGVVDDFDEDGFADDPALFQQHSFDGFDRMNVPNPDNKVDYENDKPGEDPHVTEAKKDF